MFGLTNIGVVHTAISLVALGAAIVALARDKRIVGSNRVGQLYVWTTVLTCLTGFFIFQHGGFGKAHALGVITLLTLILAANWRRFGAKKGPYVEMIAYSTTVFFHMVPAITETTTRLPVGAPWASSPEDPALQAVIGGVLVLLVIGVTLQVRWLRRQLGREPALADRGAMASLR